MKKIIIFFLCCFCLQMVEAQNRSQEYWALHNTMIKVRGKAKAAEKDQAKVLSLYQTVITQHPTEAARANLLVGEMYRTMTNQSLNDGVRSLNYYRQALKAVEATDTTVLSLALYNVGLVYYMGVTGIEQNFDSAFYYFNAAADLSDNYAAGLGNLYQYGLGVDQDLHRAIDCYARAIKSDMQCYADLYSADYMLKLYNEGKLFTPAYDDYVTYFMNVAIPFGNVEKGMAAIRRSAEAGFAPALFDLGVRYTEGKVTKDRNEMMLQAHQCFEHPALENYAPALYMNGYVYECQKKKPMDDNAQTMFRYYKLSSELGFAPGQLSLALCYIRGVGTEQNLDEGENMLFAALEQRETRAVRGQNFFFWELDRARKEVSGDKAYRREKAMAIVNTIIGVARIVADAYATFAPTQSEAPRHYVSAAAPATTSTSSSVSTSTRDSHANDSRYCTYVRSVQAHYSYDNVKVQSQTLYIYRQNGTGTLFVSFAGPYNDILRSSCNPILHGSDRVTGHNHSSYMSNYGTCYWFDL